MYNSIYSNEHHSENRPAMIMSERGVVLYPHAKFTVKCTDIFIAENKAKIIFEVQCNPYLFFFFFCTPYPCVHLYTCTWFEPQGRPIRCAHVTCSFASGCLCFVESSKHHSDSRVWYCLTGRCMACRCPLSGYHFPYKTKGSKNSFLKNQPRRKIKQNAAVSWIETGRSLFWSKIGYETCHNL